jgi:type IV conjugative transfer system coupling protein TraD
MRSNDIRFNRQNVTVKHHSARGRVARNSGDFTRGSQLVTHEFLMTFAGVRIPVIAWLLTFLVVVNVALWVMLVEHELQMILMRIYAGLWTFMEFNSDKLINVTLQDGSIQSMPMRLVAYHPEVAHAWSKAMRCIVGSAFMAAFIAAPLTVWFVDFSKRRGKAILEERHERGAMLVSRDRLASELRQHNLSELAAECARMTPPRTLKEVNKLNAAQRQELGIHRPYMLAGVPYPWRLEQSHTMLIGTTGSGKTTQLRSLVAQMRARGHRAVIFDLTGAFVEAFYRPETDTILNPMDERCPAWTIFNDCDNYADFVAAAAALIPSDGNNAEPFWAMAARTLFVEMCMKLKERGETSNAAIAHNLMTADLKRVHALLLNTIADPLTATQAAKMAESIRAVFNTNAQVLRFLPDAGDPFSIVQWMTRDFKPGSILFITSNHTDLTLNRALLTLWMDMAVNSLMRLPRTRELRTWFLFDEVHALHRLPAIEHGLQTARGFGGAFVLGMHSFDKLSETYGEQGATNLASLARTKLILATADIETAQKCTDFIGSREVRQMDEAYSYGYNNTRDASTLTPRKVVEPLVIPDDITNLPSMHGFVKFPDGFPAARIKLAWRDYPEVAPGFIRKKQLVASPYKPPKGSRAEGEGDGGPEIGATGEHGEQASVVKPTEAELAAAAIAVEEPEGEIKALEQEADTRAKAADEDEGKATDRLINPKATSHGALGDLAKLGASGPASTSATSELQSGPHRASKAVVNGPSAPPVEEQIVRETREGAGVEEERHREHELDDGMEM